MPLGCLTLCCAQDILDRVCALPSATGTNAKTGADTRESLFCP
jgi:hypothetical protein